MNSLADLVSDVASSGSLEETLLEVRSDGTQVERLSQTAAWHPLGFAKVPLGFLPQTRVALRLHVWLASERPWQTENDPHAHCWRFVSSVAWGGPLSVVHFEEGHQGRDVHRLEYDPEARELRYAGLRRIAPVAEFRRALGDIYRCERGTVHTISPVEQERTTTTLIAQGPDLDRTTPVYRTNHDDVITSRPNLSQAEVRRLLDVVLASAKAS